MFDIVFFDCDSTLITIESLDELGKRMGVGDRVSELTKLSMNGDVKIEQVFKQKIDLMSPRAEDVMVIAALCREKLVPGAVEVVSFLQRAGKRVFVVSSNFHAIVDAVADALGIPPEFVIANDIYFDERGAYVGINEISPLCRTSGKGEVVAKLLRDGERSAFVGDGITDASTQGIVDLFIGFGGITMHETVQQKADVYITEPNLLSVLKYIE